MTLVPVTVNKIEPGPIDTQMNPRRRSQRRFLEEPDGVEALPLCETEIAGLVSLLSGPEEAFVTGAGIEIDGGLDARKDGSSEAVVVKRRFGCSNEVVGGAIRDRRVLV